MEGGMMGGAMMWAIMILSVLATFLFIAALALLVAWLWRKVRGPAPGDSRPGRGPPALEILERRYARGELDREEFEEMRRELREGG